MDPIACSSSGLNWQIIADEPLITEELKESVDCRALEKKDPSVFEGVLEWFFPAPLGTNKKDKAPISSGVVESLELLLSPSSSFVLPDDEGREFFIDLLKTLLSKPRSKELLLAVAKGEGQVVLELSDSKSLNYSPIDATANYIKINRHSSPYIFIEDQSGLRPAKSPAYISLAHELIHAYHNQNHKSLRDYQPHDPAYTTLEEENTIKGVAGFEDFTENQIRKEFGLPERYGHKAVGLPYDGDQNIYQEDGSGKGPLHWAVIYGSMSDAEELCKNGASVRKADYSGITPLDTAILNGNCEMTELLLKMAKENKEPISSSEILPNACRSGNLDILDLILKQGYSPNCWGVNGLTPLQTAILLKDQKLLEKLLEAGASPNLESVGKLSSLFIALSVDNKEAFTTLLERGACLINDHSDDRLELFKLALLKPSNGIAELIFEDNQHLKAKDYKELCKFYLANGIYEFASKCPKLEAAIKEEMERVGSFWLSDFIKDYLALKTVNLDLRPVTYAILREDLDALATLIDSGADLNYKSSSRQKSPLHLAAEKDNPLLLNYLLSQGASPTEKDSIGASFAHYLVYFGSVKTIQTVLRAEDKKITSNFGNTPLHEAIKSHQSFDKIKALCSNNNLNLGNYLSNTPLHIAVEEGDYEAAEYLLEKGANPFIENDYSDKPIHIARKLGHKRIENLLSHYAQIRDSQMMSLMVGVA